MINAPAIQTIKSPMPFDPGKGVPNDPMSRVGHIRELFDLSRKWMHENYWDELADVYRAVRCRTKPIMVKINGVEHEDKNRTNVCMPELNLIVRRKTARLTANPPTLNYYVPGDDPNLLADRLTARAFYEFDRSGEAWEFRRLVQQANTFGFTYSKTFLDTVDIQRQMRYQRAKMTDRARVMQLQGADPEEIAQAVALKGKELGSEEISAGITQYGDEIQGTENFTSYDGPVSKTKFIGDIHMEPGCLTLNESSFVIDDYKETSLWLTKQAAKTYIDPETGTQQKLFDSAAVNELLEQDTELRNDKHDNLKRILRDAIQMNHPYVANRLLPQKRYRITEFHSPDKDGRLWIEYVGNDSVYLGKQPYPFDLWGRWVYTEYVPWPDIIGAIGDSSPRLLRFLHKMHNAAVGQRNDLITNILRRGYFVDSADDIPSEQIDRAFGRFYVVPGGASSIKEFVESEVPQSAWETEAQITGEMQKAEPIIGGVDSGTSANPQAAKTATTAILAAKSGDALTQFELDGLNLYLKETGEKKLEIHRQLADKPIQVPNRKQYVRSTALTERYGKTSMIEIDPYEIQDPAISVEPLAGSTLAVDDELRAGKIQTVYQMAEADPSVWNKFEAAKLVLTTIKGIGDTSKLLNDPAQQAPPGPKVGVNVSIPLDKMPADFQQWVIQTVTGQPSADLETSSKLKGVQQLSDAADAMANLHSPANKPDMADATIAAQSKRIQDKISATQ